MILFLSVLNIEINDMIAPFEDEIDIFVSKNNRHVTIELRKDNIWYNCQKEDQNLVEEINKVIML